jgi:hypothetical protein
MFVGGDGRSVVALVHKRRRRASIPRTNGALNLKLTLRSNVLTSLCAPAYGIDVQDRELAIAWAEEERKSLLAE